MGPAKATTGTPGAIVGHRVDSGNDVGVAVKYGGRCRETGRRNRHLASAGRDSG